jgi:Transposase zinc-binding domain
MCSNLQVLLEVRIVETSQKTCHRLFGLPHERLMAFSCKRCGFCTNCGAHHMAESADLLVDEVFSKVPIRQWILNFPLQLRFLLTCHPEKVGFTKARAQTGAVTLIQHFGFELNLNVHY